MNLDHLRYFLEAARLEHYGKAAKSLGISPSAVSHGISDLEEELGRKLFLRRGKNVFITPEGKIFASKLSLVLEDLSRIREESLSDAVEWEGHFRLGGTHFLCSRYLTRCWTELQNQHPKLKADIYTMKSSDVIGRVVSGELDFGICVSPQTQPMLEIESIRNGRLLIAVKQGHPILALKGAKQLRALSQYTAVLPRADKGVELCNINHPMFLKFGISPRPDCFVDSYDVIIQKLSLSHSWGFLPDWIVNDCKGELTYLSPPRDWRAPVGISAVWQRGKILNRPLQQLLVRLKSI